MYSNELLEGCHEHHYESPCESLTTVANNSEKTITCEPSVASQGLRSLNSTGTIYKELVSLDDHAEIDQDLPTITITSFCNGDEVLGEMTSSVGHSQQFHSSPLLSESVNMLHSLDAPYNSTENSTSCYENNSNMETSPTSGETVAIPNNVSMSDTDDSFVIFEPEPRTEQQEQCLNGGGVSSHHCNGYIADAFSSTLPAQQENSIHHSSTDSIS